MINLEEKYQEAYSKITTNKKPNVLICGYTGAGKTSIIQALLGPEIVSDNKISHGKPGTMDYDKYENDSIVVYDSKGLEADTGEDIFIENIKTFIREKQNDSNIDNHIHIFWYVIQSLGGRVTDTDLKIISTFPKDSTIILLSKSEKARKNQLDGINERLKDAGIEENRIIKTTDLEAGSKGIEELYNKTMNILPEAYKIAFEDAQRFNLEKAIKNVENKKSKAKAIIAGAITSTTAIAATPIIALDIAITPIQLTMIASLASLYQLDFEQLKGKILPLIAQILGIQTARGLVKIIPIAGSIISAATAGILTSGLGWFIQDQFEKMALERVKGREINTISCSFNDFSKFYKYYKKNKKNFS